jgi:hypothetical protein
MHMAGGFCANTYAVPAASARYETRVCLGIFVNFDFDFGRLFDSWKQMAWGAEPLSSFSVGAADSQNLIRIPESRISTQLAGKVQLLGG